MPAAHVDGFGILPTTGSIVDAAQTILKRGFSSVVSTEGLLWRYAIEPSEKVPVGDAGYWKAITDEEVAAKLVSQLGTTSKMQRESDRREVIRKLHYLNRERDDLFDGADPGINLSNGFLSLDPVTGIVGLVPHDEGYGARYKLGIAYTPASHLSAFR